MTTDEGLRDEQVAAWLDHAANRIEVPDDGIASIVRAVEALSPNSATYGPRRRSGPDPRLWQAIVACAAALVLVVGVVAGVGALSRSRSGGAKSTVAANAKVSTGSIQRQLLSESPKSDKYFAYDGGNGGGSSNSTANSAVPKLEKTGTIDLEIKAGTLDARYADVQRIARANGGYLADGKTTEAGANPQASATIRVPVGRFDAALGAVANLAKAKSGNTVEGRTANSLDVTAEYADLEARLRAATAERDQISLLLTKSNAIGDILAVRDRLNAVQTEVDQLQGKINVLSDQTTFASIAVALRERPHDVTAAIGAPRSGFSKAWADARNGFSTSVQWMLARSGTVVVLLLAGLALLFLVRYLYPVVRRGLI